MTAAMKLQPKDDAARVLAMIEQARGLLEQARSFDDVKKVRDLASAAQTFIRARDAGRAAAVDAGEIVLRAERRLGEWLAHQDKNKGRPKNGSSEEPFLPTLGDLGVDKKQSHHWQRLASVPSKAFDGYIRGCRAALEIPTATGARKLAPLPEKAPSKRDIGPEDVQRAREALDEISRKQAEHQAEEGASDTPPAEPADDRRPDLDAVESRSEEEIKAAMQAAMDEEPDEPPVASFETVRVADLERLIAQRGDDAAYMAHVKLHSSIGNTTRPREQRMVDFILAGGELALLRLGLDWSVTPDTLRKAYRAAAASVHPDRGGSPAVFLEVQRAHDLVKAMLGGEG